MASGGPKTHRQFPKPTSMFAQRGVTPEFSISGSQVLVVLAGGGCLVELLWAFLKYWLFTP